MCSITPCPSGTVVSAAAESRPRISSSVAVRDGRAGIGRPVLCVVPCVVPCVERGDGECARSFGAAGASRVAVDAGAMMKTSVMR